MSPIIPKPTSFFPRGKEREKVPREEKLPQGRTPSDKEEGPQKKSVEKPPFRGKRGKKKGGQNKGGLKERQ